jgi:hypothetical protein
MPNIVGHWRKFRSLGARQQRVVAAALVLLPVFRLGVHLLGLQRWRAFTLRTAGRPSHMSADDARALGALVNAVARHSPLPAACLTRSLVAEWLLRRRGIDAQLRIGVQRNSAGIAAHAWVECDGVPVNDRPDIAESFLPFAELANASSLRFS